VVKQKKQFAKIFTIIKQSNRYSLHKLCVI